MRAGWLIGWTVAVALQLCASRGAAAIVSSEVVYKDGATAMHGYMVYDDATSGPRPGVLVVPEWWGLNQYARTRAEQLAKLGYAALAIDMYGDGKVTTDPAVAGKWAGAVKGDPDLARARARAALDVFRKHPAVDPDRIAAIGYCFGGAIVLEMARAGLPVDGVVSFHGSLSTTKPATKGSVGAKVLVCHGAADPMVSQAELEGLKTEMRAAGAALTVKTYEGAKHSFTNPDADKAGIDGVSYNAAADAASWTDMQDFLKDLFSAK